MRFHSGVSLSHHVGFVIMAVIFANGLVCDGGVDTLSAYPHSDSLRLRDPFWI